MNQRLCFLTSRGLDFRIHSAPWVYLGSDPKTSALLTSRLGSKNRILIGKKIEDKAHKLHASWLLWNEQLAQLVAEPEIFFQHTLSSRSVEANPLFFKTLLILITLDLVEEHNDLTVLVDDPWIFLALKPHFKTSIGQKRAAFLRLTQTLRLSARILPARIGILIRGGVRILSARLLFSTNTLPPEAIALVGHAYKNALKSKGYKDPFFGQLPDLLKEMGESAFFLFPLHTPSSLFLSIRNIPAAQVLARWATLSDLIWSILIPFRLPKSIPPFEGIQISPLLREGSIEERGSNRHVLALWQMRTWKRFALKTKHPLIYIFENHPWEKGLNKGQLEAQRSAIGFQHSTLPPLLLNYFPIPFEKKCGFYPGVVLANSNFNRSELLKRGWDSPIFVGGSFRYFGASGEKSGSPEVQSPNPASRPKSPVSLLLVPLPGEPSLANVLLSVLSLSFSKTENWKILLKPHPSFSLNLNHLPRSFLVTHEPFEDLKGEVDAVLFCSTTVGLEAVLEGIPAFRFIPEGILTLDPIPSHLKSLVSPLDELELQALSGAPLRSKERSSPLPLEQKEFFLISPPDKEAWKTALKKARVSGHGAKEMR